MLQLQRFLNPDKPLGKRDTRDLIPQFYRNQEISTNVIELMHRAPTTDFNKDLEPPIHKEPPVAFEKMAATDFSYSGFSHMVVARSPAYTPKSADKLLSVIAEYFRTDYSTA